MGGGYDYSIPVELKYRLKWYILGKHSGHVVSRHRNTEGDSSCEMLVNMTDVHKPDFNNYSDFMNDEDDILFENLQNDNIQEKSREGIKKINIFLVI